VKHNAETYIVSGLDASYRFLSTIVNTGFYNAVVEAWTQVEALIGNDALIELLNGAVIDDEYATIYDLAAGIEKLIKKGLSVQRNKGLGEMQAEDLGETTLDQATRRLVRVTVDDFTAAGEFLGNMLNVNTVEARREIVRGTILNSEMVDA
jgi:DNA gyrase/topoisomerase IV subunit B